MSIETRSTKVFIKDMAPKEALDLFDSLQLPTPFKEILIASCVQKLDAFPAIDYLEENYHIHISYWNYVKRLKESLIMFRKAYKYHTMQK